MDANRVLVRERVKKDYICSDRILNCRINSICSPAKVGLVVIDLITSPVVSWRGWERHPPPPPPPGTAAQLSFFAQPRLGEDLSLCGGLLFVVCYAFVYVWWMDWILFDFSLSIFFLVSILSYVKGVKNLPWGGRQEVWCLPVQIRSRLPPHLC